MSRYDFDLNPGRPVSVVIPAYNSANMIADTLLSVLAQRFENFELIIVNDGSSDDLLGVVAPLAAADGRIRVVSQQNSGLAAARNRGLAEARGAFVAFLDADDLWHPDFLGELEAALEAAPDAPFAYAYSHRIDSENRLIPTRTWKTPPRHDFAGLLHVNSVGNGSAALFRIDAVRAVGGFDTSLRARGAQGAEDWKLCLVLAARSTPVLVPRPLVCYRLLHGSMSQANPARQLRAVRTVMADIRAAFPDLAPRHFRYARTMMNGWLFSAFLHQRAWRTMLRLLVESYVLHPLWFLSRDLRAVHWQKIGSLLGDLSGRVPLSLLEENGGRPFAFLNREQAPAPDRKPMEMKLSQPEGGNKSHLRGGDSGPLSRTPPVTMKLAASVRKS